MYSQGQVFILFFIIGIVIAVLFDIFRVFRKVFKTPDFLTILQDILFLFISGIIMIFSIFKLNNGELRFYIFLSAFLGISIYSLTISNFCVIMLYAIINTAKKIIYFPIYILKNISFLLKRR